MLVIFDKVIRRKKFVGTFIAYLHTKFHMANSNNSSVTAIKLEAKYSIQAAKIMWLDTLQ